MIALHRQWLQGLPEKARQILRLSTPRVHQGVRQGSLVAQVWSSFSPGHMGDARRVKQLSPRVLWPGSLATQVRSLDGQKTVIWQQGKKWGGEPHCVGCRTGILG